MTSEVLPAIRKHGGYMSGQENMSDDELLAKALMVAQSKIEENKEQIEEMKPHAVLGKAITTANTSILVGDFCKDSKTEWNRNRSKTSFPVDAGEWVFD